MYTNVYEYPLGCVAPDVACRNFFWAVVRRSECRVAFAIYQKPSKGGYHKRRNS